MTESMNTTTSKPRKWVTFKYLLGIITLLGGTYFNAQAQPPGAPPRGFDGPPPGGRFGPPPAPGFGGPPGGGMNEEIKVVEQFDTDDNGWLDSAERSKAREYVKEQRSSRRGGFGRRGGGPPFGRGTDAQQPVQSGERISKSDVRAYPDRAAFDPATLRTWFLEFESPDWETELADFNNTDVEVPATLTIDGNTYKDVGIHFRGASSFQMVGDGRKRSLNVTLDWIHDGADFDSYNTFNLLNSHVDPSFLRTVLYYQIAREYIPAPKANFVRVVINGENWGVYVNAQQFDKDMIKDWFDTKKGARWKVPGSPRGEGGMEYLGEDIESYKSIYTIKSKDREEDWQAFIHMLKVLNETPSDMLVEKLSPLLDIDGALKFLALDVALVNNDGYWVRSSDYNIYMEESGRFHIIPHDANETFAMPGGPGFGRRGGGPGRFPGDQGGRRRPDFREVENEVKQLDPLVIAIDPQKALAYRLLAVPELREKYLSYVRDIAENWLDWQKLGPVAEEYHSLIAEEVAGDTRKLDSTGDFEKSLTMDLEGGFGPGPRVTLSLKNFADQRRQYLLTHPEIMALK